MTAPPRMTFGIFLAPFHRVGENPTLALERDFELLQWLDHLGYDEAWIGEHHSAGWEIIAAPELVIAAVAQRTRHIRLGTGVTSLPYHHPFIVADRMVQLDHMTRGRAMLGIGPGALTSDAYMMGIDPLTQRERMDEALDAIMALLRCEGPVSRVTDWFTLNEARLQLRPFTQPHLEVAVASALSPAGVVAAGRHGVGVLSLGTSLGPGGLVNLGDQWALAEEAAAQNGKTMDRAKWRLVLPVHIAESKQRAFDDVREGHGAWAKDYFQDTLGRPPSDGATDIEYISEHGSAIVGTPDDAIEAINGMQAATGGFGGLLGLAHEWAPREATLRSYELLARHVMPHFQGQLATVQGSRDWVAANRNTIFGTTPQVMEKAFQDAGREISPELAR